MEEALKNTSSKLKLQPEVSEQAVSFQQLLGSQQVWRSMLVFLVPFGHAQIITATMRASGTVLWPTVISVFSIWCIEVPVAYWLSHFSSLGIRGIWIGYPVAFIVSLALQYAYYRWSWQKKSITRLIH